MASVRHFGIVGLEGRFQYP